MIERFGPAEIDEIIHDALHGDDVEEWGTPTRNAYIDAAQRTCFPPFHVSDFAQVRETDGGAWVDMSAYIPEENRPDPRVKWARGAKWVDEP